MNFNELPEFQKDCKNLRKKYRSLPSDLENFKKIVTVIPQGNSKHFNVITRNDFCCIIKARLFCKYLKGSSLRIIYCYKEKLDLIEFIEVYYKGDKVNEDQNRIKFYLKDNF